MASRGLYWVNWKNPMLLGDEHLRELDAGQRRLMAWLARAHAVSGGGWGLLAPGPGAGPALRWTPEQGADRVTVHLHSVSAIAPDGMPLYFDSEAFPELSAGISGSVELERNPPRPQRIAVLVEPVDPSSVDEGGWLEVGEPDAREEPPRAPFRVPQLRVVLEVDGFSTASRLKVGELLWDGLAVEALAEHVPACLSVAAVPGAEQICGVLRRTVTQTRERLSQAAAAPPAESALDESSLLNWAVAIATAEDLIPSMAPDVPPRQVWSACVRVLRAGLTVLRSRPVAYEHAQRELVQPGRLRNGDTHWFESLDRFLSDPYEHDGIGSTFARAQEMLDTMGEVLDHLLGSKPAEKAAPDPDLFYWKDRKYKLSRYTARTVDVDEAWHSCYLRELSIDSPKSLLVVCDRSLLVQNPRPNAGLWMLDKYEPVKANMFRVNVDRDEQSGRVVIHFKDIGEPSVAAVSLASRGLLDFSALGADPDDRVRVYHEIS